jgi:hypothetical protein
MVPIEVWYTWVQPCSQESQVSHAWTHGHIMYAWCLMEFKSLWPYNNKCLLKFSIFWNSPFSTLECTFKFLHFDSHLINALLTTQIILSNLNFLFLYSNSIYICYIHFLPLHYINSFSFQNYKLNIKYLIFKIYI